MRCFAADAKRRPDGRYEIVVEGGRRFTGLDLIDWMVQAEQLGAGEILLTSMDADGTKTGFDLPMLRSVTEAVHIPVIASGAAAHWSTLLRYLKKRMPMRRWLLHYFILAN